MCKRHFNIKVPYYLLIAKRCYFMFEDLVPSIPYLISTLLASWRICDGNLTFPATCSVSRAVITRWDLAQRNQMTQVFLVQAVLTVAWRTRLPIGCLTLAMCSAVEAGDAVCLFEHRVPASNVSDIFSNMLYSRDTSSKLS